MTFSWLIQWRVSPSVTFVSLMVVGAELKDGRTRRARLSAPVRTRQ